MSESPHKKMKLDEALKLDLPEHMTDHIISTFLPIKSFLRSRTLSKIFRNTGIRCRDLDFSGIHSKRRSQSKVVHTIESVFNQHTGSEINRFVLSLSHIGVEDKVLSWVNTCLGKNIQDLELDFSKSKKVLELPVDFSAIESLTTLKLGWCKFNIPNNSPKGLKLLKKLSLTGTKITKDMIAAVFNNCIYLESLELIECRMNERLSINAQNHKHFKSLVVYSMPKVLLIILDAPSLECYKYDGHIRRVDFSRVNALKELKLHYYNRRYNWRKSSKIVLDYMKVYTGVHVLSITNVFLEALTYKYDTTKGFTRQFFEFQNLKEFQISLKAPTICNLFDIAEFLTQCPKLEKVLIDINDFTFETTMYWKLHQKGFIQNNYESYADKLMSIKKVEILGYKNHWHELDIVEFFVVHARSLDDLILKSPRNRNAKRFPANERRIRYITSLSPKKRLIVFSEGY